MVHPISPSSTRRPQGEICEGGGNQTVTKRTCDRKQERCSEYRSIAFVFWTENGFWGEKGGSEISSGWGQGGGQLGSTKNVHHPFQVVASELILRRETARFANTLR